MFSGVPPFALLTALTLQNALLVLLVRKSKMGEPYIASVAVVVAEVLKFFICLASLFYSKGYSSTITAFNLRPWGVRARIAVPALIYGAQNNLLHLALSNLDVSTFQVLSQLKILTTAVFFVVLLQRNITREQWVHLVVLIVGVMLITSSQPEKAVPTGPITSQGSNTLDGKERHVFVGLVAVLFLCCLSGFSGVYAEKMLKGQVTLSVDEFNLELSLWSFFINCGLAWQLDGARIVESGAFQNFSGWTIGVIFVSGAGGVLTGYVMRYADNVLKVYATAVSLLFSSFLSYCFLGDETVKSIMFLLGASNVLCSTLLYTGVLQSKSPLPQPGQNDVEQNNIKSSSELK